MTLNCSALKFIRRWVDGAKEEAGIIRQMSEENTFASFGARKKNVHILERSSDNSTLLRSVRQTILVHPRGAEEGTTPIPRGRLF